MYENLFYYFVKDPNGNAGIVADLEQAIIDNSITIYKTVADGFNLSCPLNAYLRAMGLTFVPGIVAVDNTDDTILGQVQDHTEVANFITSAQSAYDAKHPTP